MIDARDKDVASMSIEAALEAHAIYHNSFDNRLQIWMALPTPRGSDPSFHALAAESAQQHAINLTMHCAEAPRDLEIYQTHYHCSPMEFCTRSQISNGVKQTKTVLAHMVNLDLTTDIPLLLEAAETTTISHNPASNCKLGNGIAPISTLLSASSASNRKRINISLGTDGAPCSNTHDLFRTMHLTSLLACGTARDAQGLSAKQVLAMATIHGAEALGLEDDVGSLEVNKKADFVVVDPYTIGAGAAPYDWEQCGSGGVDPVTVVVHSCTGRDVDMVVVDGKVSLSLTWRQDS